MNFVQVCISEFIAPRFKNLYQICAGLRNRGFGLARGYTTAEGPGSGAGKGGGAGGSVKESGGGLGKYATAQEEGFFYNKQQEQIKKLKQKLKSETSSKTQPSHEPAK